MEIDRSIIRDHKVGTRSKILADQEVREFIDDVLPHLTFEQLAQACLEKFGRPRAPRKSTINRYWRWTRGKAPLCGKMGKTRKKP